jgi:hypothetical protein
MNFTPQSCLQEEIRVSLSHLLHKAQAAQETHQIILFWYVEIAEDHETLNISEFRTWSQLSAAHHDLVFDLSSFSHHNMFDALSYSFSAAVQLIDLSSISDTLLDHVRWINLIVMSHLRDLLNDNNAVRNAYLCNWTITARQAIKTQWKEVERIECSVFAKVILYCCKPETDTFSFRWLSLKLQENKTSTVTESKGKRSVNHY